MEQRMVRVRQALLWIGVMVMVTSGAGTTAACAPSIREHQDVVYATVGGKSLALDLYMPAGVEAPPLVAWIHGGRWMNGDKRDVPMAFVERGIATASVDFRQSGEARFPAMVHDIKAAFRFLRAKAPEYGYRAGRIAIAEIWSGAHLASLVGVTNGHQALDGTLGDHRATSSDVQAIVSYYGASNLATILAQSTPYGVGVRAPALQSLLGAFPTQARELTTLASPVAHVDKSGPPLLLLHGDQDPQMPINQAHKFQGFYASLWLDVAFDVVHGGMHGDGAGEPRFFSCDRSDRVVAFLRRALGS